MKKILKILLIVLMIVGITISILNFVSTDNIAMKSEQEGTMTSEGCKGDDLNC